MWFKNKNLIWQPTHTEFSYSLDFRHNFDLVESIWLHLPVPNFVESDNIWPNCSVIFFEI